MSRKKLLLICILILTLCGCSFSKTEDTYPEYFASIIQELKDSNEPIIFSANRWWDEGVTWEGEYADKVYTCNIEGKSYVFDLNIELLNAEKWNLSTAGVFINEDKNNTYILLHDYNSMYEGEVIQNPQLILIEFSAKKPEDYKVWSYKVEPSHLFGWDVICYRMHNNIFIAGETNLGVVNLDTKEFRNCNEEYSLAEKYIQEKYGKEVYHAFNFRAVFEQSEVIVYSAQISEANDIYPIKMLYLAFEENKLIACMSVDMSDSKTSKINEGLEIEVFN